MPATTGETSEPQHIEDAYSGELNINIWFLFIIVISTVTTEIKQLKLDDFVCSVLGSVLYDKIGGSCWLFKNRFFLLNKIGLEERFFNFQKK